ncbi:uncharacterized protein LOC119840864 [Zerene cesonia]|uniref:uncharacterized protein LOC119840864 n=1 Tax=Zerene cesonia TaxID=33412 RepID=UPI0018E4EE04|nr:uncharacterized protein LOC119840864 [Zerene cesonia]
MSKRGVVLHGRAREIINNVDKYFECEKQQNLELIQRLKEARILCGPEGNIILSHKVYVNILQRLQNANKVGERVHLATGINKNTLTRIRRETRDAEASCSKITTPKKKGRGKSVVCESFEIAALHNIINSIYTVRKKFPTLNKIFATAKEELQYPGSKNTLKRILVGSLGYKFKRCQSNRFALIQRPYIAAWRAKYLRRIRENDALGADKKPVIYLGETWIHALYAGNKFWQTSTISGVKKSDSARPRWIITHAGGENGFIDGALFMFKVKLKTGDCQDTMNGAIFNNWINESLIPNIPKNSIIVMDNAPYHNMEYSKPPNMTSKKEEMQSWLSENNIEFDEYFTKAELYELIKKHKPPKNYVIDNLLNCHGFEVLRLPPYNCDLNPIEFIWHLIKRRVAAKNEKHLESQMESLTLEAINSITSDDWKKELNHVKRIENEYWQREILEDDDNFNFIIDTGNSSSDNDDDDYSDSDAGMSGIEADSD